MKLPDELGARFADPQLLGKGGQGNTYRATDAQSGRDVVVKELVLRAASSEKALELFEREARILASIDHPNIPTYVDYSVVGPPDDPRFFLVQEFVEGETIEALIDGGRRYTEDEAVALLVSILEILVYLHEHEPPILHRDIKPANVIVRPDGTPALVDFGAAQTVLRETMSNSTVVGTTGYMAPEQFTGRAVPSSDVYGLGATMVHLLTHVHPVELPTEGLRMRFGDRTGASPALIAILERMTEPALERRFPNAREVLAVLDDPESIADYQPPLDHAMLTRIPPRGSNIQLRRTSGTLDLVIPARGRRRALWELAAFVVAAGVMMSILGLMGTFMYPFIMVSLAVLVTGFVRLRREAARFVSTHVWVSENGVLVEKKRLTNEQRTIRLPAEVAIEVSGTPPIVVAGASERPRRIQITSPMSHKITFGDSLTAPEAEWIVDEMQAVLAEIDAAEHRKQRVVFAADAEDSEDVVLDHHEETRDEVTAVSES